MLMHTGIISFCDRVRYNIKSTETKDAILGELDTKYGIKILQRHWFRLEENTAQQLQKTPHWACLRSNGNPYFMYFTKFDDTNIVYFVDKKVQPGYEKPRIILGRGLFADALFKGTILDGEMVRRTDKPGWVFLVNDVIAYCGDNLQAVSLPKRIQYAYELFHKMYLPDSFMDVCTYSIKRYMLPTQEEIGRLVALSKTLPYTNRGIYLWSHNSRVKPKLVNFDESLIKSVYRKVKDCPDFRERDQGDSPKQQSVTPAPPAVPAVPAVPSSTAPTEQAHPSAPPTEGERLLWLRKTENPDIYDVFTTQQCQEKLGTAYVRTLMMSKVLRSVFKDLTVATSVLFACSYNTQFEKWTPLRQM